MRWSGRKDSVPIIVYNLTEHTFNIREKLASPFGKKDKLIIEQRTEKLRGRRKIIL